MEPTLRLHCIGSATADYQRAPGNKRSYRVQVRAADPLARAHVCTDDTLTCVPTEGTTERVCEREVSGEGDEGGNIKGSERGARGWRWEIGERGARV